jgi:hypothetical protein
VSYAFYDERPITGYAYYRIKQTDLDGNNDYSKIIVVEFEPFNKTFENALRIMIYPNPIKGNIIYVNLNTGIHDQDSEVSIIDPAGKVYYFVNRKLLTNQFDIPIEENLLKSGLYMLRVRNNSGIHIARFIIN